MNIPRYFIAIIFLGISITRVQAQTAVHSRPVIDSIAKPDSLTGYLHIRNIVITGNRKTKSYIILREIQFAKGDSIQKNVLQAQMQQAKAQVYNTNLFAEVNFTSLLTSDSTVIIYLSLRERWYVYPSPQFQLIDRNLSEWLKVYHADLQRVTYGAKYTQYNLSGRRDVLRLAAITGYTRNISFSYEQPFSNKKLTEGFAISAGYTQNREMPFKVDYENKFVQYKSPDFARSSAYGSASYIIRKGFFKRKVISFGVESINILDTNFNAGDNYNYLNSNKEHVVFPNIGYGISYSNTDNNNYPLKGKIFGTSVLKRGLGFNGGVNMLQFEGIYRRYDPFGHNWYGGAGISAKVKLPFSQAFINQRAIGFGSLIMRGLDYHVVDGVAAAVLNYTLKKKVFSFDVNVPIKNRYLQKIPFTFFIKTFADAGYAYSEPEYKSRLNNKFLYTGGFGLDVLTFYDIVIGAEYGFNQLGEKGLFLRIKGGF